MRKRTTKKALLVVDMQVGLTRREDSYDVESVVSKIASLLEKGRASECEVIFIQHVGEGGGPLHPSEPGWVIDPKLSPLDGEMIVHKFSPDSFWETNLDDFLKGCFVEELIITGMRTEICVDTTCREAVSRGYGVTLVSDAHTTTERRDGLAAASIVDHHNSILDDFGNVHTWIEVRPSRQIEF